MRTSLDVTVRALGVDQRGNLRLEARAMVPMMTMEAQWRAWPGIATYLVRARRSTYTLSLREPDGCVFQIAGNTPNSPDVIDASNNASLRAAPSPMAWMDLEPGGGSNRVLTRLGLTGGYRRLGWVLAPPIGGARQPVDAFMHPPIEPGA